MKKTYSKPEIFYESFSLSQNIAAGCEIKDPHDPKLEMTGAGVNGGIGYAFSTSCDADVTNGGGDGWYNNVCYHVFGQNVENPINVHTS